MVSTQRRYCQEFVLDTVSIFSYNQSMVDQGEEQALPPGKPFLVSDYREGHFQPNGEFSTDPILSPEAIARWEDDNRRILNGKAWGRGQALFFREKPLVFGRKEDAVDVIVDSDPDPNGNILGELGVSRRHFELSPPQDKKIKILDLGSTNGVKIYSADGKPKDTLKGDHRENYLEVGDFTLFGGGEDRLIGFRVCEDKDGKIFLVKFNAKEFDELLALIVTPGVGDAGLREKFSETMTHLSPGIAAKWVELTDSPEINSICKSAFHILVDELTDLRARLEAEKKDHPSVLAAYQKLFGDLFRLSGEIGDRFYSGDWEMGAGLIGQHAMQAGEKAIKERDPKSASHSLDLALLAFDLASHKLVKFTKEE